MASQQAYTPFRTNTPKRMFFIGGTSTLLYPDKSVQFIRGCDYLNELGIPSPYKPFFPIGLETKPRLDATRRLAYQPHNAVPGWGIPQWNSQRFSPASWLRYISALLEPSKDGNEAIPLALN